MEQFPHKGLGRALACQHLIFTLSVSRAGRECISVCCPIQLIAIGHGNPRRVVRPSSNKFISLTARCFHSCWHLPMECPSSRCLQASPEDGPMRLGVQSVQVLKCLHLGWNIPGCPISTNPPTPSTVCSSTAFVPSHHFPLPETAALLSSVT